MGGRVHRIGIGLAGSVGVHAALVAIAVLALREAKPEPSKALPIELIPTTETAPPPRPPAAPPAPEPKPEAEPPPRPKAKPRPKPAPAPEPEPVAEATAAPNPDPEPPAEEPPAPEAPALKPEASLDLRPYVPGGAKLMVVVRTDRLRGSRWAPALDSVLAPMPDYQTVIAPSKLPLADTFETVVIATPDARDVTATFLAARTTRSEAEVKAALTGAATKARVVWTEENGFEVGKPVREGGAGEDPRVLLVPGGGWMLYTRPEHVTELLAPAPGSAAARPAWMERLSRVITATGEKEGPVLVVAVADVARKLRILPGKPPAPRRATLAVHAAGAGFVLSGTLVFADEAAADTFLQAAEQRRKEAIDGVFSRGMLRAAHALGVVEKLNLRRQGASIELTSELGAEDAAILLEHAAAWSRDYFEARRSAPAPREPIGDSP